MSTSKQIIKRLSSDSHKKLIKCTGKNADLKEVSTKISASLKDAVEIMKKVEKEEKVFLKFLEAQKKAAKGAAKKTPEEKQEEFKKAKAKLVELRTALNGKIIEIFKLQTIKYDVLQMTVCTEELAKVREEARKAAIEQLEALNEFMKNPKK